MASSSKIVLRHYGRFFGRVIPPDEEVLSSVQSGLLVLRQWAFKEVIPPLAGRIVVWDDSSKRSQPRGPRNEFLKKAFSLNSGKESPARSPKRRQLSMVFSQLPEFRIPEFKIVLTLGIRERYARKLLYGSFLGLDRVNFAAAVAFREQEGRYWGS